MYLRRSFFQKIRYFPANTTYFIRIKTNRISSIKYLYRTVFTTSCYFIPTLVLHTVTQLTFQTHSLDLTSHILTYSSCDAVTSKETKWNVVPVYYWILSISPSAQLRHDQLSLHLITGEAFFVRIGNRCIHFL